MPHLQYSTPQMQKRLPPPPRLSNRFATQKWGHLPPQTNRQQRNYRMTTNNHNWRIKVNNHPELSDLRTYYFDDQSDIDSFAQGLLCEGITEFSLYHNDGEEWVEQETNPYDFFTTIDDTPFPLAHGQLLPNLEGDVSPEIIWSLAHGNKDALDSIDNESVREKAERIFESLSEVGAWDEPESLSQENYGEILGDDEPWKWASEFDDTPNAESILSFDSTPSKVCIESAESIPGIEINALSLDTEIDQQFTEEFNLDELI